MTTETAQRRVGPFRGSSSRPVVALVPAVLASLAAAAAVCLAAAVADGAPAADAALMGGILAVGVLAFGAFSVNVVAGLAPRASLPIAMSTYLLQVLAVLAVLLGLERSGAAEEMARGWLVAGLVLTVLAWLVGHVLGAVRQAPSAVELGDEPGVEEEAR